MGEAPELGANTRDKEKGRIGEGKWQLKASLGAAIPVHPQHPNRQEQTHMTHALRIPLRRRCSGLRTHPPGRAASRQQHPPLHSRQAPLGDERLRGCGRPGQCCTTPAGVGHAAPKRLLQHGLRLLWQLLQDLAGRSIEGTRGLKDHGMKANPLPFARSSSLQMLGLPPGTALHHLACLSQASSPFATAP